MLSSQEIRDLVSYGLNQDISINEFRYKNCPMCLEEFTIILKPDLLVCGHFICRPCRLLTKMCSMCNRSMQVKEQSCTKILNLTQNLEIQELGLQNSKNNPEESQRHMSCTMNSFQEVKPQNSNEDLATVRKESKFDNINPSQTFTAGKIYVVQIEVLFTKSKKGEKLKQFRKIYFRIEQPFFKFCLPNKNKLIILNRRHFFYLKQSNFSLRQQNLIDICYFIEKILLDLASSQQEQGTMKQFVYNDNMAKNQSFLIPQGNFQDYCKKYPVQQPPIRDKMTQRIPQFIRRGNFRTTLQPIVKIQHCSEYKLCSCGMTLNFTRNSNLFSCSECLEQCLGISQSCSCGFSICFSCLFDKKYNFFVNNPRHLLVQNHRQMLTCDMCGQNSIQETYSCRQCDFDLCKKCIFTIKIKNLRFNLITN